MRKLTLSLVGPFILSCLLWSCNSGEEAVKEAENDVFAIHDKIMPKMDDIMKMRKQLKQRIASLDSLKESGSASATLRVDEEREQASRLRRDLDVADSLMMNWMDQYNGDTLSKLPSEEALRYLSAQKDQINDVNSKIKTSLEQASQFLGKK
ncbi:viral A-type inclusion protein [Spirosoma aerophilum]